MRKIIKILTEGTIDCYVKRPIHAKDKMVMIGMFVYAEKDANGFVTARKRAPRGGGNCAGVVLSDKPNREGMHEIAGAPHWPALIVRSKSKNNLRKSAKSAD